MNSGDYSYLRQAVVDAINADALGGKTEMVQALLDEADRARAYEYKSDDAMFRAFQTSITGKVIRGRALDGFELLIDTNSTDGSPRYFVNLFFTNKEYDPAMSKEEKLLRVVFDQSPQYAWRRFDIRGLLDLLQGKTSIDSYEWTLDDETPPGSPVKGSSE